MKRRRWAGIEIAWDTGDLPVDPFAPVVPLELEEPDTTAAQIAITIAARLVAAPTPSPEDNGGVPVIFHGTTRCYACSAGLVIWNGASTLSISPDGSRITALVHPSSLERAFHFSSVTVMMTLLLALRHHGLFHLHAAAARWAHGATWLVPGESGSGKSTLALALFAAGAAWLSDDAVLLRAAGADVEVIGWSRMIRMTTRTANAFPALRPMLTPCPTGSARDFEVDPRRAFPARGVTRATRPLVLLYPRIAETAESRSAALDHAEAFGRILHACAWVASEHLPGRDEQLTLLARLVGAAPAFELQTGTHLLHDPTAAIAEIRAQLASRSP
jgi:hypothetical protein